MTTVTMVTIMDRMAMMPMVTTITINMTMVNIDRPDKKPHLVVVTVSCTRNHNFVEPATVVMCPLNAALRTLIVMNANRYFAVYLSHLDACNAYVYLRSYS